MITHSLVVYISHTACNKMRRLSFWPDSGYCDLVLN